MERERRMYVRVDAFDVRKAGVAHNVANAGWTFLCAAAGVRLEDVCFFFILLRRGKGEMHLIVELWEV